MATTADIKNGLCINHNGKLSQIIEFQHVKPGKGPAFVRTKMRQIESGKVSDFTFSAGHKIEVVRIESIQSYPCTSAIGMDRPPAHIIVEVSQ